jgi:hypothetical protein
MADIFGYDRGAKVKQVFSSENTRLNFATGGANVAAGVGGWLIQNWNVDYSQEVQEVFELGSNALYWVKGRPQGAGSISRVIGPLPASTGGSGSIFPREAFDICLGGATFEMEVGGGACEGQDQKSVKITMDGVIITRIGFQASVQDVRVVEAVAWRFAHLEVA